jgi:hypothetical protein
LRLWSVFAKGVDRNSIGLPPIPLEDAEWMGHRRLWQKQKRSSAASRKLIEEQPQIPFGFAQGRLSTHHPQTEERLGPRSLRMTEFIMPGISDSPHWSVFAKGVDRNSIGLPPIPLENAEWMGHRSLWQKQKRSSAANQKLIEEQPQIPFGFAQGRLSTHHPQTEERLGPRSPRMTASGDAIVSGRINNPERMRAWTPARQPVWRPALRPLPNHAVTVLVFTVEIGIDALAPLNQKAIQGGGSQIVVHTRIVNAPFAEKAARMERAAKPVRRWFRSARGSGPGPRPAWRSRIP